jgi:hypothetical protein
VVIVAYDNIYRRNDILEGEIIMAISTEWQFIFAMFLMYGFIFMIYTISNGAIAGLPSANIFNLVAPSTSIADLLIGALETVISFFVVIFIIPLANFWWIAPINWAIMGTTIYLFIRILRGGG